MSHLKMYTCGATVYDVPHIGNLRSFCHADNLRRLKEAQGYTVTHVMNITDIDDKILDAVGLKDVRFNPKIHLDIIREYTEPFIQKMKSDMIDVGIDITKIHFVKVSDFFLEMDIVVANLYEGEKAKITEDQKDIKLIGEDFSLWKVDKNRPGWHLECTVLINNTLGKQIDIHTGGIDLKFPHHHNENIQNQAIHCCDITKEWSYCEHLFVDGVKMSKSLGNCYTLDYLKDKGYTGMDLRRLFDSYNYENVLDFTFEKLDKFKEVSINVDNLSNDINKLRKHLRDAKQFHISDIIRNIFKNNGIQLNDDKI